MKIVRAQRRFLVLYRRITFEQEVGGEKSVDEDIKLWPRACLTLRMIQNLQAQVIKLACDPKLTEPLQKLTKK